MITPEDIQKLKEACEKATPGPWRYTDNGFDGHIKGPQDDDYVFGGEPSEGRVEGNDPNVVLVMLAREYLPKLLDEVEELEQVIESLSKRLMCMDCGKESRNFVCSSCR